MDTAAETDQPSSKRQRLQQPESTTAAGTSTATAVSDSPAATAGAAVVTEAECSAALGADTHATLQHLCACLLLPSQILETSWHVLSFAVKETTLLRNRHVHQLLMCSIFGVCKLHKTKQVTFKQIVTAYKKLPGSFAQMWCDILLEGGQRGNLIAFYNEVFVAATKRELFAFQEIVNDNSMTMLPPTSLPYASPNRISFRCAKAISPSSTHSPARALISPKKVVPEKYGPIHVSPMRPTSYVSPSRRTLTPRSSLLHCTIGSFGSESPSRHFVSANESLRSPSSSPFSSPAPRQAFVGGTQCGVALDFTGDEPQPMSRLSSALTRQLQQLVPKRARESDANHQQQS